MPWGDGNDMPYRILDLIEKDETLATCQEVNSELCYGSGLAYVPKDPDAGLSSKLQSDIDEFFLDNDIPSYFLGISKDFKHFGFAVSVIILNDSGTRVLNLVRKEAMYCRFAPKDKSGQIPYLLYANWRNSISSEKDVEKIEILNPQSPWRDLKARLEKNTKERKFAIISKIATVDSTYYPIPYYGALFRGKWYNIKQLIGIAKESKLKNSAPIKYHIEVSQKYWDNLFNREGITDRVKRQARVIKEKQQILDFLTGAENSGKVWFSQFYVDPTGKEQHDVVINKIDSSKEGGDWETDIQEAINMICFTMRVHSNLVGSVPGKAQTNNSGSDKRELYTISQALQKPYRDILFKVHDIIIRFNGWSGVKPSVSLIQLTTLDEHKDAKKIDL
ncbi:MAG: hypothetical protein J1E16_05705 [Muribaculaceae bacterium]|nr:hypothetical protein [Muribaculaceae bacterium]